MAIEYLWKLILIVHFILQATHFFYNLHLYNIPLQHIYNIYTQSGYKNCGKSYIKAFQILKCLFEVCFGCGKQGLHNEELAHKQLFCALAHYRKKIHRTPK